MVLPHIALYVLLFLYLIAGAWAFAKIESNVYRNKNICSIIKNIPN